MPEYQQRVIEEKCELDARITKLTAFFDSDDYRALPHDEQTRLMRQLVIMGNYSEVLGERIAAFPV